MRNRSELRLECLKLANSIACGKNIKPTDVIPTAMEYFKWVDDAPKEDAHPERLQEKFRRDNPVAFAR